MRHIGLFLIPAILFFSCQGHEQAQPSAPEAVTTETEPLPPMPPSAIVAADHCETATLEITLNKDNRASKESLMKVMAMLAKEGRQVTMEADEDDSLIVKLLTEFPVDPPPAEDAPAVTTTATRIEGWLSLQEELSSVEGVSFACSKKRPSVVTAQTTTTPPSASTTLPPTTGTETPADPQNPVITEPSVPDDQRQEF